MKRTPLPVPTTYPSPLETYNGFATVVTLYTPNHPPKDVLFGPSIRRREREAYKAMEYINKLRLLQGLEPYPVLAVVPVSVSLREPHVPGKP